MIDDEPTVVQESTAKEFYMHLRPAVRAMALRMEDELRLDDHKPGWDTTPTPVLFKLLEGEVRELAYAIAQGNPQEVASEAGDVGNIALMIADVVGGLAGDGSILGAKR